ARDGAAGFGDVGIDDEIIVAVNSAVVIEVAIGEPVGGAADVRVDGEVVVAVEHSVEIGVAAPGVLDEDGGRVGGFAGEERGLRSADVQADGAFAGGEGGEHAGALGVGHAGDDPAPVPHAPVTAGLDVPGDAGV